MTLASWVQVVRNVQTVHLLHLMKHQELNLQTASRVPLVKNLEQMSF